MFEHHYLKVLTLSGGDDEVISGVGKREDHKELSDELQKRLREEEQEKAQISGADEFASIKKHVPRLLESNKHDTAATALESYLKSFPRSIEGYFLLASIYEHAGAYGRALEVIHIAMYLQPTSQRINRKLIRIEDKALGQQKASLEMKVKCYSPSRLFEEWGSAASPEDLDEKIKTEVKHQIATDLSLLSSLSTGISLSAVSQYYENVNAEYEFNHISHIQLPYRLHDTFPFQCIATKSLPVGSLLMADVPFAIAPLLDPNDPKLFPTCFHCLKERPTLDQGFACPLFPQSCPFLFCSSECVLRNVNIHRQECGFITSIVFPLAKETGFSPGFVLLVLRALTRAHLERSLRKSDAQEIQYFFRLHSFASDYKTQRPWVWNCISALARGLCFMLPLEFRCHMGETELSDFIATTHSNAIPLSYNVPSVSIQRSAPTASLGLALCHNVCSLGHSCVPTCSYTYTPDNRVVVRTLVDVPEDGVLTISFIEDLFLPVSRRKHLESSWKVLLCSCKRCREVHEGGRHVSGQRCENCVRGVRNPLQASIMRGILQNKMEQYPQTKSNTLIQSDGKDEKENFNVEVLPSWYCNLCGELSPLDANRCDVFEAQLNRIVKKAMSAWGVGERLKARNMLEETTKQYGTLMHPNHYILYRMNVFLAGLWSHGSGKNLGKALVYLRKAILAAHAVLPHYHAEKVHLFESYADITFALSVARKVQQRGPWMNEADHVGATSKEDIEYQLLFTTPASLLLTPIEAQWLAVINALIVFGSKSAAWISALQRIRHLVRASGQQHTPPLLYVPKVTNVERAVSSIRRLLHNQGLTIKVRKKETTTIHVTWCCGIRKSQR